MRRPFVAFVAALALLGGGVLLGRAVAPDGSARDHGDHAAHAASSGGSAPAAPGAADVGFAQDMAVHHDQAVHLARLVRGRVDPRVDALAAQVIEVQTRETGMLRGWLDLWGAPQLPDGPAMAWMHDEDDHDEDDHDEDDHGAGDEADGDGPPMPGMASAAEVEELGTLEGAALEARFLQLMVRHHRGGIEMAGAGADRAHVPEVRAAAQLMATEQHQEIALMVPLLTERGASELP